MDTQKVTDENFGALFERVKNLGNDMQEIKDTLKEDRIERSEIKSIVDSHKTAGKIVAAFTSVAILSVTYIFGSINNQDKRLTVLEYRVNAPEPNRTVVFQSPNPAEDKK